MADMPDIPKTPDTPRARASHALRERATALLSDALSDGQITLAEFDERSAAAWRATYADELVPLVADLTPAGQAANRPAVRDAARRVDPAAAGSALSVSVLGGTDFSGTWTVAPRHLSITLLGGNELDLREAVFAAEEVVITCIAVFGGIDVIVPEDVRVVSEGVGILGGF